MYDKNVIKQEVYEVTLFDLLNIFWFLIIYNSFSYLGRYEII